jgi:hypothetical protein
MPSGTSKKHRVSRPLIAWIAIALLEFAIYGQSMKNLIPRAESRSY